jgi:hypothetical protein
MKAIAWIVMFSALSMFQPVAYGYSQEEVNQLDTPVEPPVSIGQAVMPMPASLDQSQKPAADPTDDPVAIKKDLTIRPVAAGTP